MPNFLLNGEPYRLVHKPRPSPSFGLKIYLPNLVKSEMMADFLFDSGSCDNFLTISTYKKLCRKYRYMQSQTYDRKYKVKMANDAQVEFPYMVKEVIIKFEYGFPLPVFFIVNAKIKRNIIGLNALRPYMRWVLGTTEFYILRRD